MIPAEPARSLPRLALGALLVVAVAKLGLHFLSNAWLHYEYFIDEFYYIACGKHLAWGYVDHPPLAPFLMAVSGRLFGYSLFAVRLFPSLAGAAMVVLSGLLARELGGGRWAQILAALAAFSVSIFLTLDTIFSMNAFRMLFWSAGFLLVARIIRTGERKWWYWLGLVLGVGLLNKISMLWFGGGLAVGLLLTRERRWYLDRGPWICAGIAFIIFAPHVAWQISNGWPTLEFLRNEMAKTPVTSLGRFLAGQILSLNPILLPLWLAGLYWLLFDRQGSAFRLLGWIYLAVFAFLAAGGKSRPDYLAPACTALLAGGAVLFECAAGRRLWPPRAAAALIALGGLAAAPLFMPLLPVQTYLRYRAMVGMKPITNEKEEKGKLPKFFADMEGWEYRVEKIAEVYDSLPETDKAVCILAFNDYGMAGAVDLLGSKYDLPRAIATRNNYFLWGPGERTGEVVITCDYKPDNLRTFFREVTEAGRLDHPYGWPERNQRIYICRGIEAPLRQVWPGLKQYN